MKNIITSTTRSLLAATVAICVASCNGFDLHTIVGSGNVKTETRKMEKEFTKISASRGLDVEVSQADVASVVVEADDNLLPGITTRIDGETLVITSEYNSYSNVTSKKVIVRMPVIKSLETESGANLSSVGSLRSENLELSTSSGSGMKVVVEADELSAESSSGSHMVVSGKALEFETSSSSGSGIEAGELLANKVRASASSGSSIEVHPIVKLEGSASSGGSVTYDGDPQSFSKDESSGGSVSKK